MINHESEAPTGGEVSFDEKKSATRFKVNRVEFTEPDHADEINNRPQSPSSGTGSNEFSQIYDSPQHTVLSVGSNDSGTNSKTNDTHFKTFGRYTHEALPHVDHYRNLLSATNALRSRPTLEELHEEKDEENLIKPKEPLISEEEKRDAELANISVSQKVVTATKFGWIKGVLVRCLLNIWGVMLFLRLSWVVGQAGIGLSTLVVLLSCVVTVLTSLSMAAICTNGQVKGGGAYYMISRSLGPEFGGAIGLIFSVANAVAVAMYVVGFAETVRDLLVAHDALMIDEVNDIRIVGIITITVLFAIAIIGLEWEARAQVFLLIILIVALINFVIGTFIPPTEEKYVKGFTGYDTEVFEENFFPDFRGEGFFSVFSIFFPAATGILAGANISGDLKDAQYAIPRGTMYAIVISSAVYILVTWLLGSCIAREAAGYMASAAIGVTTNSSVNYLVTGSPNSSTSTTLTVSSPSIQYTYSMLKNCSIAADGHCKYGLLHDFQVMEMVSGFGPLITAGIFSATLSSALASLVSAPKVFQAVCKDKIFPGIHVFAKGYGHDDNPKRAYVLAYFIGIAFICIGDLNAIAPIISNFFLMSYTLINYSCFDASLARSPGWRPAFRYYSMWLSLLGALLCLAVMFVINWWTALITFAIVAALFVYVHYRKPDVNWGSSSQAHVYRNALQTTLKLLNIEDHIKNFRPQVLVLTGNPTCRPALVDFVSILTKKISLMVCGNIILGSQTKNLNTLRSSNDISNWLHDRKIKAFYSATTASTFRVGVQSLLQISGIGKLKPNILIMGFKSDWGSVDPMEVSDYFNVIHDAFDLDYGVGILRIKEGFYCENPNEDICDVEDGGESADDDTISDPPSLTAEKKNISDDNITPADSVADVVTSQTNKINHSLLKSVNRYRPDRKQKKGTIDVWWLFDDGGLTLLLPYLLTTKSQWSKTHLRVFVGGTKRGEIDREQRQLATMLTKFRIDAKAMNVVPDIGKIPKEESKKEFDNLIEGWLLDEDEESPEKYPWKISQDELTLLKDKTNRHIRLKELLLKHSSEASLIIVTLPMPRKGTCSPGLYMAWVDYITRDMPPILLLRGNQKNVLTFYS